MNKNNRRILAASLVIIGLTLIFIINGVLFAPQPEPTVTPTAENTMAPGFHVPEIPGTLVALVLGVMGLLVFYLKK
ncbi:hypothetical protein KEJ47_01580 [Candidatus Bathyarchaeota archaeon]|nr:hypothetical protein [Candidatus Bathyarchaeota archaeon]